MQAEEAEVVACLEGLKHFTNLRRWPATVESDCLHTVQSKSSKGQLKSDCWFFVTLKPVELTARSDQRTSNLTGSLTGPAFKIGVQAVFK
jgi:hypothetical protein